MKLFIPAPVVHARTSPSFPIVSAEKGPIRLMLGSMSKGKSHYDIPIGVNEAWSAAPVVTPTPFGLGISTTSWASPALLWPLPNLVPANGSFTVFMVVNLTNLTPADVTNVQPFHSPNTSYGIQISAGTFKYWNNKTTGLAPLNAVAKGLQVIAVRVTTTAQTFYRNGQLDYVGASADLFYGCTGTNMYRGSAAATENHIVAMGIFDYGMSDAELAAFTLAPMPRLVKAKQRDLYLVVGGGASSSITFTAAGSLLFSGSTAYTKNRTYAAVGDLLLSGAAAHSKGRSYATVGNLLLSGAAGYSTGAPVTSTYTAVGALAFSGNTAYNRSRNYAAVGNLLLANTAAYSYGRSYQTTGSLTFSGAAAATKGSSFSSTGSLIFYGTTIIVRNKNIIAGGVLTFNGTAYPQFIVFGTSTLVSKQSRGYGL